MVEPESHLRLVPTACPTRSTRPKRITTSTSTGNIRKKLAKTGKNATSAISHIRICDLTWNELTGMGRKRSGNVHSATSVFVIGSNHTFSLFGYSFLKVDFVNYFTKILKFKLCSTKYSFQFELRGALQPDSSGVRVEEVGLVPRMQTLLPVEGKQWSWSTILQ